MERIITQLSFSYLLCWGRKSLSCRALAPDAVLDLLRLCTSILMKGVFLWLESITGRASFYGWNQLPKEVICTLNRS